MPNAVLELSGCTIAFVLAYGVLAPRYPTRKQQAWIITALASATMTLASIPFVYDYLTSLGDVAGLRLAPAFAPRVNLAFQAYLLADLLVGWVNYREHVNLLTGWVHHIAYIVMLHFVIRASWSHIFCLALSMEFPTFLLALARLHPSLRHDLLFAASFFATRIAFHLVLIVSYASSHARRHATGGSIVPSLLFAAAFPLHASWFAGCVRGLAKRTRTASPIYVALSPSPSPTPLPTPADELPSPLEKSSLQSPPLTPLALPEPTPLQFMPAPQHDPSLDFFLLRHLATPARELRIRALLAAASHGRYARLAAHATALYERVEPTRLAAFRMRGQTVPGRTALQREVAVF